MTARKFSQVLPGRWRFSPGCTLLGIMLPARTERPLGWTRHGEEGEAGGVGANWAAGCP